MTFLTDVQELKTGLIIFRRSDVEHQNWYCRVRVPDETVNRYKTISLKTPNEREAKDKAFEHDSDIRFRKKHGVPVFDKTFEEVALEYSAQLEKMVDSGQITKGRRIVVNSYIKLHLIPYMGHLQIIHVGETQWKEYPFWRKKHNAPEKARSYGGRKIKAKGKVEPNEDKKEEKKEHVPAADGTIRGEMATFRAIMNFAADKQYIRERQVPKGKLIIDNARREAFTLPEYRHLHTQARKWRDMEHKDDTPVKKWYRQMAYEFMLVMTNTGMRTIEARTLKWKHIDFRKDKEGRKFIALYVEGKKKYGELVAASNVVEYFERIKKITGTSEPNKYVFCNYERNQCSDNYDAYIKDMLQYTGLLDTDAGGRRSAYSFRHTYATFRLMEGVDVYPLARQMRTSVQMIEKHYGHITPSENAGLILQGVPGWEPIAEVSGEKAASVNAKADGKKRKTPPKEARGALRAHKGRVRPTAPSPEKQAHRPPRRA
jgi:integrase